MSLIQFDNIFKSKADAEAYGLAKHAGLGMGLFVNDIITDCLVTWSLDPDMRERGIKSMGLSIVSVTANIYWELEDNAERNGTILFDSTNQDFSAWKIVNDMKFQEDGSIGVNDVSIDFGKKEVTIS